MTISNEFQVIGQLSSVELEETKNRAKEMLIIVLLDICQVTRLQMNDNVPPAGCVNTQTV